MTEQKIKEKIRHILETHKFTVIATVDLENNKPEAAVISFAEKEDLGLIFGTSNLSRKYKNIQTNPHVSFVIGWSPETGSVQYEGVARELSDKEVDEHAEIMVLKNKQTEKFRSRPDQRYFLVTPKWIRFVDTTSGPLANYEISF